MLSNTAPFICTQQKAQTFNPLAEQSKGWVLSLPWGFRASQRLARTAFLEQETAQVRLLSTESQTWREWMNQKTFVNQGRREQQPQRSRGSQRNQATRSSQTGQESQGPKAKPNSASKGYTSPPAVIFKSSLRCGAILHPPLLLIRPDLQMSASFRLSQHNCHI